MEGYPEYIARKQGDNGNLISDIKRLIATEKTDNNIWIMFDDGTGTVIPYYKSWLLVQYSIDIKNLSYEQLLADTASEQEITEQMMKWFHDNK